MRRLKQLALTVAALLVVSACGEITTPGEELRLQAQRFETAYRGEPYSATIRAIGGLSPYRFQLEAGSLPPGLELQGNTIRGTATETGRFTFTVTVSDANLSKTFQEFSLQVSEPPAAELSLNTPTTEMHRPFLLRGEVSDARELQGFRTLLEWDAGRFELVENSVRAVRNDVVVLKRAVNGALHVDVAFLGEPFTGDGRVFELELTPLEPSTIEVTAKTEFATRDGGHSFATLREGRRPQPERAPEAEDPDDTDELDEFDDFEDFDEFDDDPGAGEEDLE